MNSILNFFNHQIGLKTIKRNVDVVISNNILHKTVNLKWYINEYD